MKITKLIKYIPDLHLPKGISDNVDLIPSVGEGEICEKTLLFIYKRIGGEYSIPTNTLNKRPYAIVTDEDYPSTGDIPILHTQNVRRALSYAYYLDSGFDPAKTKLVGITGTNGKTTTSTLVSRALNASGIKCGHIGTGIIKIGNENIADEFYSATTPDAPMLYKTMKKMQNEGCRAIVMEVSSHSIALDKVAPLIFDISAFTNLSGEHMDFHGDMESYFNTKMELFRKSRLGLFNIDSEYGERGYNEAECKSLSFGILRQGDIYCTDIHLLGLEGSEFYYRDAKRIFNLSTKLPGAYNIYNTAMATAILIELGMPACIARRRISEIDRIEGRLEVVRRSPTVIIDYAHTPFSLDNVLKTIKSSINVRQRLIVVFGCGGNRDKSKRKIMGEIASKYADKIILTEDNSRNERTEDIIQDILSGVTEGKDRSVIFKREEAITYALCTAADADVVAIIGKGHERYIIDTDGYRSFSETEIIQKFYGENPKDEN